MTTITIDGLVIHSMESAKRIGFSIDDILKSGKSGDGMIEFSDLTVADVVDHEFLINSGIPYEKMMGTLIKEWRNEK